MKPTLTLLVCWWCVVAGAATFNSPTAGLTDVQNTANLATDGDTVTVPPGNLGWTSHLTLSKNIKLIGSGAGSTIITNAAADANAIIWTLTTAAGTIPTVSGIEFRGGSAANPFTGIIELQGTCFTFRCCSNLFYYPNNRCIQHHGWIYGVYDHNTMLATFKQFAEVWHDGYGGGTFGDNSWADVDFAGTTNGVYFENNFFSDNSRATPGAIDMMGGARCFIRFNTFSNCNATTHGTDSTGRTRSVRWLEEYNNTLKETSGFSISAGQYRGGSGLVCSNTYIGPDWSSGMQLAVYRELYALSPWGGANGTNGYDSNSVTIFATGTHTGANGATVLTDGTKNFAVNVWASTNMLWNVTKNMASRISANTATTVTYDLNGSSIFGGPNMTFDAGDTYQIMAVLGALDEPGRGQQITPFAFNSNPATPVGFSEVLSPIYSWSNTVNGVLGMDVFSFYPSVLQGRNYNPGTIKPGWTPLVYPHPLVGPSTPSTRIARVTTLRAGKTVVGP